MSDLISIRYQVFEYSYDHNQVFLAHPTSLVPYGGIFYPFRRDGYDTLEQAISAMLEVGQSGGFVILPVYTVPDRSG